LGIWKTEVQRRNEVPPDRVTGIGFVQRIFAGGLEIVDRSSGVVEKVSTLARAEESAGRQDVA